MFNTWLSFRSFYWINALQLGSFKKEGINKLKNYVVLSNGCVGYISKICNCDACKQRGELELFINTLDGTYMDCLKHHELFDKSRVLNVGNSIDELSVEHTKSEIANFFADVYQKELFKSEEVTEWKIIMHGPIE